MSSSARQKGFSMIELLTVMAIIAFLLLAFMFLMRNQKAKGNDARRKADLEQIKISFEDYFSDNECYPPEGALDECGGRGLSPYLNAIPCDPLSREPYAYEPVANCGGYRAYAALDNDLDPIIGKLGCDGPVGCGALSGAEYNYGISVGVPLYGGAVVVVEPTPTPSVLYLYACDSAGVCNKFDSTSELLQTCPISFPETDCRNLCNLPSNRCTGF